MAYFGAGAGEFKSNTNSKPQSIHIHPQKAPKGVQMQHPISLQRQSIDKGQSAVASNLNKERKSSSQAPYREIGNQVRINRDSGHQRSHDQDGAGATQP
jgi:hypothetical protein